MSRLPIRDLESYRPIAAKAKELLDSDPMAAVEFAEAAEAEPGGEVLLRRLSAYVLTHAGELLADRVFVERGAELWRSLGSEDDPDIVYNVANTEYPLFEMTVAERGHIAAMLEDRDHQRLGRSMHERLGRDPEAPPLLRVQALTNCGNAYDRVGRSLEAVARYREALEIDPSFGMALGNRAIAISAYASYARQHAPALRHQAARELDLAIADEQRVLEIGGKPALAHFREIRRSLGIETPSEEWGADPADWDDPHQRWCRENELFLCISHDCLRSTDQQLDPLFPRAFLSGPGEAERRRVDDLIDAFNVLKQEFIAARYLIWMCLAADSPNRDQLGRVTAASGFLDSLREARWGARTGVAIQAFTAVTNILDKVASFIYLYLGIDGGRFVYFRGFWRAPAKKNQPEALADLLADELSAEKGNVGLMALWDLACDLEEEQTLLGRLIKLRHAATHRFLVSHDAPPPERSGEVLERVEWNVFRDAVLDQLQVARAALIYLVRMVDARETRTHEEDHRRGKVRPELLIPLADLDELDSE